MIKNIALLWMVFLLACSNQDQDTQIATEMAARAASKASGEIYTSDQSQPVSYSNEVDYIRKKCFSRSVFFRDKKPDNKIYGNLSLLITKKKELEKSQVTLRSPACKEIIVKVDISEIEDDILEVVDEVDIEAPICSGDVCGLDSKEVNLGLIAEGIMQFNKTGMSFKVDKVQKLSISKEKLDVEFTDSFITDLSKVIEAEYRLVNPDF